MSIENILTSQALEGMRRWNQWIVYVLTPSAKNPLKNDKIPIHYATGNPASVTDPKNWTDVHTAAAAAKRFGPSFGVGFCFTRECGYFFVDLDSCLVDGVWSPLAQQLSAQVLVGAAIEVSSSGKGLHLFGRGVVPPHASKCAEHHAELYTSDRFVAMSGLHLSGNCDVDLTDRISWVAQTYFPPREHLGAAALEDGPCDGWSGPEDDEELLRRALQSKSAASTFGGKASFADLWHADADVLARSYPDANGERGYDASSADAALAQMLAFWTGKDAQRIERLMRQSDLAREKWDSREDYLPRTIGVACGQQRDVLVDKKLERADISAPPPGSPEMQARAGQTFLNAQQQAELFKGCIYIVDAHRALVPGGRLLKPDQFRALFGGYTFSMDARNERTSRNAWEAFTESQVLTCPKADGTCFRPDLPYGAFIQDPGRIRANFYAHVSVRRVRGDVSPFLRHMAKLLPNERDRMVQIYYAAGCVQNQGYKSQWATVLQGVEGNGKTLLSRCVAEAIGRRYVHWPKASKLNANFNGWMYGKTFFAVEDIHTSENVDVIEALKPMITGGDGLEIESKGVDQISAEICGNFMFNSNYKTGLRKTRNDRRFCVLYCAQQTVEDLKRDGMDGDYMQRLYHWLKHEDGYAIVAEYLWTLEIPDEFNFATGCQRAPLVSSTDEAIEAGRGRVEQEVLEMVERGEPGFMGGWISSTAVDKLLDRIGKAGAVALNRRRDMLRDLGYDWHPALAANNGRVNNNVLPDNAKPKLYVRRDHPSLSLTSAAEVAKAYAAAQGFK